MTSEDIKHQFIIITALWDQPHFAAHVAKDNTKNSNVLSVVSHDDTSKPFPSTSSEPFDNGPLLKKVIKPARIRNLRKKKKKKKGKKRKKKGRVPLPAKVGNLTGPVRNVDSH